MRALATGPTATFPEGYHCRHALASTSIEQFSMKRTYNALGNGIRELGIRLDDIGLRIIHG